MDQISSTAGFPPAAPATACARWIVGGASARGSRHAAAGVANEDAFRVSDGPLSDGGKRFIIAAADGHGAAIHHRAALGAEFAVDAAAAVLGDWLNGCGSAMAAAIPAAILQRWRAAVETHAAAHPLPPACALGWGAGVFTPYGSTLIAAAGDARRLVVVQIGDGDALLGFGGDRIERPLADDIGLWGEQTYSLCQPEALGRFRLHVDDGRHGHVRLEFVAISTDGVAKSFVAARAFTAGVADLGARVLSDPGGIGGVLPGWLADKAHGPSRDDATLCLALRSADQ